MTMISYAQNYEDVMLWRALKHVKEGFYIDVGANDPEHDSVTRAFYDVGWHGINIEPVTEWFERLEKERPRDTNLKLAAGETDGELVLYEVTGTGMSTTDESIAREQAEKHGYELRTSTTPVRTLTSICEEHAPEEIHFLKIDVEGAEGAVLRGLDLTRVRPWIIVVESTLPHSEKESRDEWEGYLTGGGYHNVYFDGLNRFYVADEHGELDSAFNVPPNFFDDFMRASEYRAQQLQAELGSIKADSLQLEAVYNSMSWRITAPLRTALTLSRKVLPFAARLQYQGTRLVERLVNALLHRSRAQEGKRPRLSVCISTYNRAEWLSKSLENLFRLYPEPLEDVEFLVCDNASTDHTLKVVKPYFRRKDFVFHQNFKNVGMLGNLRVTAQRARGEYVWILGDDDLLVPGAVERVLAALEEHGDTALVYLNYAFTHIEDARTIKDFEDFFSKATPIVPPEEDIYGPIRTICARNENFFTAIYTLVFRRDHALRAYSQDTSGRPFSTMLTCIPTTYYVLNKMMDEPGVWIGEPQVVVNMNVSWLKYAPLWILERLPEVYELAEHYGAAQKEVDRWRRHTLKTVAHYFKEIYTNDPHGNAAFFEPERLVRRFRHLPEFAGIEPELRKIYTTAQEAGHPAAARPIAEVFSAGESRARRDPGQRKTAKALGAMPRRQKNKQQNS